MNQRTLFVTGAGSGIGAATTRLFAERGWLVAAADINQASLDNLLRSCPNGAIETYVVDVRDRKTMEAALTDFASSREGRLDAVFACAGVLFMGNHEEISTGDKELMIDVNIKGILNTIDPAFPYLRQTPRARIVAMASTSAEYGTPEHAVYSATKFWIRGLTEALDIEYRRYDIRVSGIYVPYVDTPMVHGAEHQARSVTKMGVNVAAEDVAKTVWKAIQGGKAHWRVGLQAWLIHWAVRLFGGLTPVIIRRRLGF